VPLSCYALFVLLATQPGLVACTSDHGETDRLARHTAAQKASGQPIGKQFAEIAEFAVSNMIVEGLQYSLIEDGEVVAIDAFGVADRESQRPMTTNTAINVASISKALTAWAFIILAEREGWDIDTPVDELLSDKRLYADLFSDYDVSARMLLSHTSGLSGPIVRVTPAAQALPILTDILHGRSSVAGPEMEAAPGFRFSYSGLGYLVLQKIIEDQTQETFSAYMSDALLLPIQMRESSFALTRDMLDGAAIYYRDDGRRREPYHLPGAAGGLYSTARDMAKFILLYTDAGAETRARLVSNTGFAELVEPVAPSGNVGGAIPTIAYALGHYTYETPEGVDMVFHSGGNPGLRALLVIAPVNRPSRSLGYNFRK
jgi:CubicO group peptidase (beta-lactamase class C family)